MKLVARRVRADGADWRRVAANLPIRGLAAVMVVSAAAEPARDRLVRALSSAVRPRAVPDPVAVLDEDRDGGDVRLLQYEGRSLSPPAAAVLWKWVIGTALVEVGRGADGLLVDVAAGDRAGNEAVDRWMTASRKGAEA